MLFSYGTIVGDSESTATKNAGKSMAISMAMAMQRYDASPDRAYPGLHSKPLDARCLNAKRHD